MKKLGIIAIIIVFSIFSSSIIHAQGNFPFWQYPNFYGQYGQQWGVQPYIPGNFGSYNSIPQPWSSQLRLSSESPSNLIFNSFPAISPFGNMLNNFSYTPSMNGFGYQSNGKEYA